MKKLLLFSLAASFLLAGGILPKNFAGCSEVSLFTPQNAPIALNDNMKTLNKYSCENQIVYIGIEQRIPGILKLNVNNNTKNFMLKHLKIQNFPAAVYIDKNLQKGVVAVKLTGKYALKVMFYTQNYKPVLSLIDKLNLNKIRQNLLQP